MSRGSASHRRLTHSHQTLGAERSLHHSTHRQLCHLSSALYPSPEPASSRRAQWRVAFRTKLISCRPLERKNSCIHYQQPPITPTSKSPMAYPSLKINAQILIIRIFWSQQILTHTTTQAMPHAATPPCPLCLCLTVFFTIFKHAMLLLTRLQTDKEHPRQSSEEHRHFAVG